MKVKQIVGEHKKGVRAMKYAKKTKSTVPVYGPEANDAKLKPVKPAVRHDVKEAVLKAYDGKQATIDDPEHGKTINLDLTKPENAASLRPNDKGELEYDVTPDMATPGAQPGSEGPKPGTNVTIKTDETHQDIGGDAGDNFIDDVVDHEFEKNVQEAPDIPYQVKMGPQPMAMTSPAPTAIVASKKWTAITPEIEAKASAQGFRKVMLKVNGQLVPGLEGGDQALGSKIIVAPSDFQQMSVAGASTMRRPMSVQSAEKTGIGAPLKESDELYKMLTIAGLK